jgi:vitamin B12 transporter
MILYDGSAAPGDPTYFNGAAARARGLEAGLSTALGRRATASASYTYLLTEATDDAGMPSPDFASGERLIRRPAHSAELAVRSAVVDRVTLGGSVTYVGSRDDVDFNQSPSARVTLPAYAIVDLAGEVSGTVRVENLFNQRYDQVVGFAGRPRGVFGGARFRF